MEVDTEAIRPEFSVGFADAPNLRAQAGERDDKISGGLKADAALQVATKFSRRYKCSLSLFLLLRWTQSLKGDQSFQSKAGTP